MANQEQWKIGDRVLAAWEPQWLYPGVISAIDGGTARIDFDDGDCGHAQLAELRSIVVAVGAAVQARRDRSVKQYQPAEVIAVHGEFIEVSYADGTVDALDIEYLRIPRGSALVPRPGGMAIVNGQNGGPLMASLERLVNGLVAKEFSFLSPATSPHELQERLASYDESRLGLFNKVFGYAVGMTDVPEFVKTITEHVVGIGAEPMEDEELTKLHELMVLAFPLSAIGFSKLYGPRFVALVDGDSLTDEELHAAMDCFQQINLCLMQLGSRLSLRLFGKSLVALNCSAATGSLIAIAGNAGRADLLRQWASAKPLHSDTIVNQLKERFSSIGFWLKAAFGFIEYKPHQLRQEVIVLNGQSGQASSSATGRLAFEFGFSLSDIATG